MKQTICGHRIETDWNCPTRKYGGCETHHPTVTRTISAIGVSNLLILKLNRFRQVPDPRNIGRLIEEKVKFPIEVTRQLHIILADGTERIYDLIGQIASFEIICHNMYVVAASWHIDPPWTLHVTVIWWWCSSGVWRFPIQRVANQFSKVSINSIYFLTVFFAAWWTTPKATCSFIICEEPIQFQCHQLQCKFIFLIFYHHEF